MLPETEVLSARDSKGDQKKYVIQQHGACIEATIGVRRDFDALIIPVKNERVALIGKVCLPCLLSSSTTAHKPL
jgi:hypothetical protein